MRIEVNGEQREFTDGITLAEALVVVDAPQQGVAVALDGQVIARGEWVDTVLNDGARLEVVTATQGG